MCFIFEIDFCLRCFNSFGDLITLSWLNSANWPRCVKLSNYVSSPHSQCLHIRAMQIRHEHTHCLYQKHTTAPLHCNFACCHKTLLTDIKANMFFTKFSSPTFKTLVGTYTHRDTDTHTHSHTPLLFLSLYLLHLIPFGKDRCKR